MRSRNLEMRGPLVDGRHNFALGSGVVADCRHPCERRPPLVTLGGFQFQPSELAKLALTLYLCRQATRAKPIGTTSNLQGHVDSPWLSKSRLPVRAFDGARVLFRLS